MNKGIRFTDEFKQDAVVQVAERGYAVSEVAERLGIRTKSLFLTNFGLFVTLLSKNDEVASNRSSAE